MVCAVYLSFQLKPLYSYAMLNFKIFGFPYPKAENRTTNLLSLYYQSVCIYIRQGYRANYIFSNSVFPEHNSISLAESYSSEGDPSFEDPTNNITCNMAPQDLKSGKYGKSDSPKYVCQT